MFLRWKSKIFNGFWRLHCITLSFEFLCLWLVVRRPVLVIWSVRFCPIRGFGLRSFLILNCVIIWSKQSTCCLNCTLPNNPASDSSLAQYYGQLGHRLGDLSSPFLPPSAPPSLHHINILVIAKSFSIIQVHGDYMYGITNLGPLWDAENDFFF